MTSRIQYVILQLSRVYKSHFVRPLTTDKKVLYRTASKKNQSKRKTI
jgi:hypothetical protein